MKYIAISIMLFFLNVHVVNSSEDKGTITFIGAIISAPCIIGFSMTNELISRCWKDGRYDVTKIDISAKKMDLSHLKDWLYYGSPIETSAGKIIMIGYH